MPIAIPSDRPAYRILATAGFYGPDDHLYKEGDIIVYADEPNEEMEPLNEPARDRMKVLIEKLDGLARAAAEKNGRTFVARPRTQEDALDQARADARRVQLVAGDGGVPLMGAKRDVSRKIERLGGDDAAEDGRKAPDKLHQIRAPR